MDEPETESSELIDKFDVIIKCPKGHCLHKDERENTGWRCDGYKIHGKCKKGCTDFDQTYGWNRFRCKDCDFDLCSECIETENIMLSKQNQDEKGNDDDHMDTYTKFLQYNNTQLHKVDASDTWVSDRIMYNERGFYSENDIQPDSKLDAIDEESEPLLISVTKKKKKSEISEKLNTWDEFLKYNRANPLSDYTGSGFSFHSNDGTKDALAELDTWDAFLKYNRDKKISDYSGFF